MKKSLYGLLLSLCILQVNSQTIINDYFPVTAGSGNIVTVSSLTGPNGKTLAIGDTVLVIQMQGATMNQSNSASFGTTTVNNSGNFELSVICGINTSTKQVELKHNLVNSYTFTNGGVQLVSHGDGKTVNYTSPAGGLTTTTWTGTLGGVVFIKASGTTTLNGNIDASGRGFRGGSPGGFVGAPGTVCNKNVVDATCNFLYNNDGCNGAIGCGAVGYFYPANPHTITTACGGNHIAPPSPNPKPANNNDFYMGGGKGEGIVPYILNMETGRGAQSNGGGGGQAHNSGGGGGGNTGAGGNGGDQYPAGACVPLANGGVGGRVLPSSTTKLFMGGGGGSGHGNYPNGAPSAGANGGGIIIIVSNTLNNTGTRYIYANGNNVANTLGQDSEGGGGAGGSIYFDVLNITNTGTLNIQAHGGNGGDSYNVQECIGTGGGGGGGYIVSRVAIPGTVTQNVTGGTAGIVSDGSTIPVSKGVHYTLCGPGAPDYKFNAKDGSVGLTSVNTSLKTKRGTVVITCVLSVDFISFNVIENEGYVNIRWSTSRETNNKHFIVERSHNGIDFEALYTVEGKTNSNTLSNYSTMDIPKNNGTYYYRIKQVDLSGQTTYTHSVSVEFKDESDFYIYPNPSGTSKSVRIQNLSNTEDIIPWVLNDQDGRTIRAGNIHEIYDLNTENIKSGIYFLEIHSKANLKIYKLIITH